MDDRHLYDWLEAEVELRTPLVGGIPAHPDIVKAWIRKKLEKAIKEGQILEDELITLVQKTLIEAGIVDAANYEDGLWYNADGEQIPMAEVEAQIDVASEKYNKGFSVFKKTKEGAPYIEARQINAMLRENLSVMGEFEKTRGTKNVFQHLVHVEPLRIFFYRNGKLLLANDGETAVEVLERPVHSKGPSGTQTSIKRAEFIAPPATFRFWVKKAKAENSRVQLKDNKLESALLFAQSGGLGSDRTQDGGRLNFLSFEKLTRKPDSSVLGACDPAPEWQPKPKKEEAA